MILIERGLAYWTIAKRCRQHPHIRATAVRDMQRLQQETGSQAVLKRINNFIAGHRTQPPGGSPNDSGPRYA